MNCCWWRCWVFTTTTFSCFWTLAGEQNGYISLSIVPLVKISLYEQEEIRELGSNHFCRLVKLLSLNLGPLIKKLGLVLLLHRPDLGKAFMVILLIILLGKSQSHKLSMLSGSECLPGAVDWNAQLTAAKQSFLCLSSCSHELSPIISLVWILVSRQA